jgi:hypothetical protein
MLDPVDRGRVKLPEVLVSSRGGAHDASGIDTMSLAKVESAAVAISKSAPLG